MSACFADVTFTSFTWDIVCTLLRLLGISNRSNFHQCPTECMFSTENALDIETVPNASEFFRNTIDILDNDRSLVYCI
jgi:hypothetical protein